MKYRKKSVVIEAIQFDGTLVSVTEMHKIFGPLFWNQCEPIPDDESANGFEYLRIKTLEGLLIVSLWDWVIKGVKGEFYPCKPDIFELTYEPASQGPKEES